MPLEPNIPADRLPAALQARRAVLAARTGRPGPVADAICVADSLTREAGLATYTEAREALASLLELVELLAFHCADRVDVSKDERIANANRVASS